MFAKANESLSIAQIVGNVASTVLNAAEKDFGSKWTYQPTATWR
jgi:hypothetical protein